MKVHSADLGVAKPCVFESAVACSRPDPALSKVQVRQAPGIRSVGFELHDANKATTEICMEKPRRLRLTA